MNCSKQNFIYNNDAKPMKAALLKRLRDLASFCKFLDGKMQFDEIMGKAIARIKLILL